MEKIQKNHTKDFYFYCVQAEGGFMFSTLKPNSPTKLLTLEKYLQYIRWNQRGGVDRKAAVHPQGGRRRRNKSALKKATRFTSHLILNSVLKSYKRSEKGQNGATI